MSVNSIAVIIRAFTLPQIIQIREKLSMLNSAAIITLLYFSSSLYVIELYLQLTLLIE